MTVVAPLPNNEALRLETLRRYAILDTPPEGCFDRITRLAARQFQVPIALLSLVDDGRQWFKSKSGLAAEESGRDVAFCAHAILQDDVYVVPDAMLDPLFAKNPLVTGEPHVRFYAGAPLIAPNGAKIGTLCIIDRKSRPEFTACDRACLKDLAAIAVDELEMRSAAGSFAAEIESRLETEGKLRATAQKLDMFVQYAPFGIAMLDAAGRFLSVSERWRSDHHLIDAPLIGHHYELVAPESVIAYGDSFESSLAGEVVSCAEHQIERNGGWTQWSRWEMHPWWDDSGAIGGVLVFSEDITEKKEAELELKRSQEFLAAVLDNVQEGIVACDAKGELLFLNQEARRFHGTMERSTASERRAERFGLYHADGKTLLTDPETPLVRAFEGEIVRGAEVVIAPPGLAPRQLVANARAFYDREGSKLGAVASMRDVTQQRKAEEDLLKSERRHRELYNRTPVMMLSVSPTGRLIGVSDLWLDILGYCREEVIGKQALDFLTEESRNDAAPAMTSELMKLGFCKDVPLRYEKKGGGAIDVLYSSVVERGEGGQIGNSMAVLIDVSEWKMLEEKLLQSQKMEAVGQLTGGLAHDFNNLLAVVIGNLELLERSIGPDAKAKRRTRSALDAAQAGAELTRRLLAFSRKQVLQAEVVQPASLITEMEELLKRALGETIELQLCVSDGGCSANIDPHQLKTTLLNLAVNARDAMPDGGELTIETAVVVFDEADAAQNVDTTVGEFVVISISDTGCGMSPEVTRLVFEPFFTTKEVGKGTGLGLSMVYGFAKQSGGWLKIYSEAGIGTTVRLYLPRKMEGVRTVATGEATSPGSLLGSETILVVEDNGEVRDIVAAQLTDLGYKVVEADSGAAALHTLEDRADIDLLFTDMVMAGGMNGADLAQEALSRYPQLKVLYTSGFTEASMLRRRVLGAKEALLTKPYARDELARAMRQALDQGEDAGQDLELARQVV